MKSIRILFVVMLFCFSTLTAGGFLKVSGKYIVNVKNEEVMLRGIGLGGWLLPEGYMLQTSSFANAFWEMKLKVVGVVGQQKADTFWAAYRKNFVQRKDIERLSQLGFNSVRVALHWEFFMNSSGGWLTEGFTIVDSLLRQCADNNIYLILDLHAAPGGQNSSNISDYHYPLPSLWQSDTNKIMTINLWKKLAERYKDEPWIGGYDLLNETVWDLPPNNKPLRDLYIAITDSIRSVDTTHIIFIEGNIWANDFTGLTPPWDDNMVYSFHKYWNSNDVSSINFVLTLRDATNRPLWMGESGENSNAWFTDAISLLEANHIGWSWWTLKKFNAMNGMYSVPITPEYNYLLRYWSGKADKPSVEFAMKGLMDMAEGLKLEKCIYNSGVIDAMFRQVAESSTLPFAENKIPGRLYAANYDYGRYGVAYRDNEYQNAGGGAWGWNSGDMYRNDGVDIEKCSDTIGNGYDVFNVKTGEYLKFTVNVTESATYRFSARVAANADGAVILVTPDNSPLSFNTIAKTGDGDVPIWKSQDLFDIDLTAGIHTLKFTFYGTGLSVNYVDLTNVGTLSVKNELNLPKEFALAQNYPNPFNPTTVISYQLSVDSYTTLKVYDLLGKEIATLVNEQKNAGTYSVQVNGEYLPSGMYFYTLQAGSFTSTKKLMLLK
ncbi:MAG: cellulase family glycosylhydrolase [Bacteroidota bacterium]|nr:cellulase family glycosylhydrolase [Bacteroidota bacterium]